MKGISPDKLKKYIKKFIIVVVIVAIAGAGVYFSLKIYSNRNVQTAVKEMTVKVTRGDIDVTLTGTGTVEPIARYDIVPLVTGSILSAPFEEGDKVKKGDLLYEIDSSDLSYNIKKAQNAIERLKINSQNVEENIRNMEVVAPCDGRITNLTVKEGEEVSSNKTIAEIVNDKQIIATVPYNQSQIKYIKVGQQAQILFPDLMQYIDGTVKWVSSTPKAGDGGYIQYDVEIVIDNPGAIAPGMEVTGIIKAENGDIVSPLNGTTGYYTEQAVLAKTSGKVKQVFVKNNEWVKAGQKILSIENDDLYDTVKTNSLEMEDSKISLDAQLKKLKDYNILSPIDGTVIKKYYKAGDTIGNSSDSKILMTVADLSKMVFTMDVDELDIAKVSVGQKVKVTADALPNEVFEGEVTNVSMEGETSNGVTIYPVEVTISEPGNLKPGMNVNAEIQVESKKDVLILPLSAITKVGNKSFVFVKTDGPAEGQAEKRSGPRNVPDGAEGAVKVADAEKRAGSGRKDMAAGGRRRVEVVVGVSNDEYIEIVSGLKEGDEVYLTSTSTSQRNNNAERPGMPGGGGFMGGGGPPPGGMR